jgi:hypothetical protein
LVEALSKKMEAQKTKNNTGPRYGTKQQQQQQQENDG